MSGKPFRVNVPKRTLAPEEESAAWLVATVKARCAEKKPCRVLVEINIADGQVKKLRMLDETTVIFAPAPLADDDGEKLHADSDFPSEPLTSDSAIQ